MASGKLQKRGQASGGEVRMTDEREGDERIDGDLLGVRSIELVQRRFRSVG